MPNADPLPYVSRHLLRLIVGRKTASAELLLHEVGDVSDLRPALDALTQRRLIKYTAGYSNSYSATKAGLDIAHTLSLKGQA